MLIAGLVAYGAVFALVGARLKRPLVIGLVFAFGWEPAVLLFPGYLKQLTVAYYLQALVPHAMPQDSAVSILMQVFREVPPVTTSLALSRGDHGSRAVVRRACGRAARIRPRAVILQSELSKTEHDASIMRISVRGIMTTKTRYFVILSLSILTVGVGTGLTAYYVGFPAGADFGLSCR